VILCGLVATLMLLGAACSGPVQVRFDRESCFVDGHRAGLQEVEEREAEVQHRIGSRQPWLIVITVAVVALAGMSYIERLLLLFSANRDPKTMGDRVKAIVTRYRAHPVRYFAMVGGSVGMLVLAGFSYIYLDADKRSSERALGTLQFCHLALRTGEEKKTLDDQRTNLDSLHQTAGEIRQLMDKLPPAEQVKAQEIIGHMDDAVGRQGRFIAERLRRSEDTTETIRDGTLSIERGLTGLESAVGGLKELPGGVKGLGDGLRAVETRVAASERASTDLGARLLAVQHAVDALASRPAPTCPACVCAERPAAAVAAHAAAPAARDAGVAAN
jgi:hypothetical protein